MMLTNDNLRGIQNVVLCLLQLILPSCLLRSYTMKLGGVKQGVDPDALEDEEENEGEDADADPEEGEFA